MAEQSFGLARIFEVFKQINREENSHYEFNPVTQELGKLFLK